MSMKTGRELGELLAQVEPKDLLRFGMIPEFIGRFPIMSTLNPLNKEDLVEILLTPKSALTKQYKKFFELENVKLTFQKEALDAIASEALRLGTGARGLRSILEDMMLETMYDIPSQKETEECVITSECVTKRTQPLRITKGSGKHPQRKIA